MNLTYKKPREFIYRNARPFDLARWRYHFEAGSNDEILTALACYQNEDGGFGHALEPDSWNPNSAPVQTWTATEILREINFTDNSHPIIKGILRYLESGQNFNGKLWLNIIESNNDYPHASWWHYRNDMKIHNDYNPTACLAGFIIRFADRDSKLYKLGCRIAEEAFKRLMSDGTQNDMFLVLCYIRLMEYLEESKETGVIDLAGLKNKLMEGVKSCIYRNTDEWETLYVCKPSHFLNSPDSILYKEVKELADYECEFIIKTQLDDGSWNIPWSWSEYPDEWAISKNWWKSNGIIQNIIYLRNFGKL